MLLVPLMLGKTSWTGRAERARSVASWMSGSRKTGGVFKTNPNRVRFCCDSVRSWDEQRVQMQLSNERFELFGLGWLSTYEGGQGQTDQHVQRADEIGHLDGGKPSKS